MTSEDSRRRLVASLRARGPAPAYLVTGADAPARRSLGHRLAQALFCTAAAGDRPCDGCAECRQAGEGRHPDLVSVRGAADKGFLKIDQVREMKKGALLSPYRGTHRVYLVEATGLREEAAAAFLKTLEEPPETAVFVLLFPHEREVPPTILSRVVRLGLPEAPPRPPALAEAAALLDLDPGQPAALFALARKIAAYPDEKLAAFLENFAVALALAAQLRAGARAPAAGDPPWLADLAGRGRSPADMTDLAGQCFTLRGEIRRGAVSARLALENLFIALARGRD